MCVLVCGCIFLAQFDDFASHGQVTTVLYVLHPTICSPASLLYIVWDPDKASLEENQQARVGKPMYTHIHACTCTHIDFFCLICLYADTNAVKMQSESGRKWVLAHTYGTINIATVTEGRCSVQEDCEYVVPHLWSIRVLRASFSFANHNKQSGNMSFST